MTYIKRTIPDNSKKIADILDMYTLGYWLFLFQLVKLQSSGLHSFYQPFAFLRFSFIIFRFLFSCNFNGKYILNIDMYIDHRNFEAERSHNSASGLFQGLMCYVPNCCFVPVHSIWPLTYKTECLPHVLAIEFSSWLFYLSFLLLNLFIIRNCVLFHCWGTNEIF